MAARIQNWIKKEEILKELDALKKEALKSEETKHFVKAIDGMKQQLGNTAERESQGQNEDQQLAGFLGDKVLNDIRAAVGKNDNLADIIEIYPELKDFAANSSAHKFAVDKLLGVKN